VRNALDAMDGQGELVLSAYVSGNQACIEVKDTGKGIPASKHKTVFRPGYTTKSRGWGLGLSLAKRIVEEYHGGKIFVKESVVGQGSTFAIEVPLASN
jgi:signal transduction histidine kinase